MNFTPPTLRYSIGHCKVRHIITMTRSAFQSATDSQSLGIFAFAGQRNTNDRRRTNLCGTGADNETASRTGRDSATRATFCRLRGDRPHADPQGISRTCQQLATERACQPATTIAGVSSLSRVYTSVTG